MAIKDEIRLAVYWKWQKKCGWCRKPILYSEMEIDHFIPQSLRAGELADALELHGLGTDHAIDGVPNLMPACGRCNGTKGNRPPPNTPIISILLERAAKYAPDITAQAQRYTSVLKFEVLAANISAVMDGKVDPTTAGELVKLLAAAQADIVSPEPVVIASDIHPALRYVINPQRWVHVGGGPDDRVVSVHDGRVGGYTGTSDSGFKCPHCGSHGPWRGGTICLTCGQTSDPSD